MKPIYGVGNFFFFFLIIKRVLKNFHRTKLINTFYINFPWFQRKEKKSSRQFPKHFGQEYGSTKKMANKQNLQNLELAKGYF